MLLEQYKHMGASGLWARAGLLPHSLSRAVNARLELLLIAILVGAAFAIRVWAIGSEPISRDEAFSWRLTSFSFSEIIQRTATDVHPPAYYILLKAWRVVAGDSLAAMRGLSAIAGCASVLATYIATRQLFPRLDGRSSNAVFAATVSGALMAVNGLQVSLARAARMYAFGGALLAFSFVVAVSLITAKRLGGTQSRATSGCFVGFVTIVVLSLYTHNYLTFSWAIGLAVAVGGTLWRGPNQCFVLALGFLIAMLAYLPWCSILCRQTAEVVTEYWITPSGLDVIVQDVLAWSCGIAAQSRIEIYALLALLAALVLSLTRDCNRTSLAVLSLTAGPWLMPFAFAAASGRSIYQLRYLSFSQPFVHVAIGASIARLPMRFTLRLFISACVVGAAVSGLSRELALSLRTPSWFAEAVELVVQHAEHGDVVLLEDAADLNRFAYQLRKNPLDLRVRTWDPRSPEHLGHIPHIASLKVRDYWSDGQAGAVSRIWIVSSWAGKRELPSAFVAEREFSVADESGLRTSVRLYTRRAGVSHE